MKQRSSLYCGKREPIAPSLPLCAAERMKSTGKVKKWRERVTMMTKSLDQVSLKVSATINPIVLTHTLVELHGVVSDNQSAPFVHLAMKTIRPSYRPLSREGFSFCRRAGVGVEPTSLK